MEEGEDWSALEAEGLHDREEAFDKAAAAVACAAERVFAPEDAFAKNPFGVIVGRFDIFLDQEGPGSFLQVSQIRAEGGDGVRGAAATAFEKSVEISNDGQKSIHQLLPRTRGRILRIASAAEGVPRFEDAANDLESVAADGLARAAAIEALLKVAFEVSPADLSTVVGQAVVRAPTIADEDAVNRFAQQHGERREIAASVNDEGGHGLRGGDPQPTTLAGLFPAGFVDVLDGRLANRFEGLFVGRRESVAHLLFHRRDGAQRQGSVEDVGADFFQAAFADVMTAGQIGQRRGQPWSATVSPQLGGNRGFGDFAAAWAGSTVPLIFGDDRGEFGQLGDLMSARSRIVWAKVAWQRRVTRAASLRQEHEDLMNAFGRKQLFQVRRMPRLSAWFSTRRLLLHRRRSAWRIGRRRNGRVLGIGVQSLFERRHAPQQIGNDRVTPPTSWAFGSIRRNVLAIHADMLPNRDSCSCAAFP